MLYIDPSENCVRGDSGVCIAYDDVFYAHMLLDIVASKIPDVYFFSTPLGYFIESPKGVHILQPGVLLCNLAYYCNTDAHSSLDECIKCALHGHHIEAFKKVFFSPCEDMLRYNGTAE